MSRARRKERNSSSRKSNRYEEVSVYDIKSGKPVSDLKEFARVTVRSLTAKNQEQQEYINSILNRSITICTGKAGSGKTFIPSVIAAQQLYDRNSPVEKIILVRPNEPLGKSLGMLPGDLKEKLKPWLAPIADGVKFAVGEGAYNAAVEFEKIEYVAVEHLRGITFRNSFVVIDEAQNLSVDAVVCLLTRIGEDCKMVLCGDIAQKDIKADSGLGMLLKLQENWEKLPFNLVDLEKCVRSDEASAFCYIFEQEGLL